jgi:DNA polymerase-3 subunit epsilon
VHDAPKIDACFRPSWSFSRGAVQVAHNAGFDIGFLRAAAQLSADLAAPAGAVHGAAGPPGGSHRDEAPSVKLSALAQLFGAQHHADAPGTGRRSPRHRRRPATA